ncbi:MAG: cell division FtsZ family protein, partial [Chitinophagaceae bacterium]|nr:cell division FtsZ family protein [Chitinophagaceae bacterium]
TGTGGAPIISKICRELGILTVGIVTTPFSYEGRKRQMQAEEGIKVMKQYVDTLLVISNDKLRHQFGNLKMKEAFSRADNVLATAAKCITDVINSTGQINVDFADVCTVMKNGGVAILGSAACGGEDRAHRTIEEALNSPLLNDNDIRGAKWILININSAEGDHEFTMDEVEVIQNYLLEQAGEGTDVILGMGYDNTLGDKIGITLIATGFEHKDPFDKVKPKAEEPKRDEKIVLTLAPEPAPTAQARVQAVEEKVIPTPKVEEPKIHVQQPTVIFDEPVIKEELAPKMVVPEEEREEVRDFTIPAGKTTVDNKIETIRSENTTEWVFSANPPMPAASKGYLARPSNIYAETDNTGGISAQPENPVQNPVKEPVQLTKVEPVVEEEPSEAMQLVIKDEIPVAADEPRAHQTQENVMAQFSAEEPAMQDEVEQQKRRAAERIQKLRNLSFNINAADPNNEFETVPAYIRRNLDLYNSISHVENFYSNYEVKSDGQNKAQISTINTFLDGKKPD